MLLFLRLGFHTTVCTTLLLFINHMKAEEICGKPPNIDNAQYNSTKTVFDHSERVQYKCKRGYARTGYPYTVCIDGEWRWPHSLTLNCKEKSCGWPGDVANGGITSYLFSLGSTVHFVCDDGYELKGNTNRICLVTGSWSGRVPTCERVKCPRLRLSNGKITDDGRSFKDRSTLTCNEGYELKGSEERTCQADKQWSGEITECQEITCTMPKIESGHVEVEEPIKYGALALFRCVGDRVLMGAQTSACSGINKWSQPFPQCILTCQVPVIENGEVTQYHDRWYDRWYKYEVVKKNRVDEGTSLFVSCNGRFVLHPKPWTGDKRKEITCTNGMWADVPTCARPNCTQTPRNPYNGKAMVTGKRHGDTVTYKCHAGYSLQGPWVRRCDMGRWTSSPPNCNENYCSFVSINNRTIQMITGGLKYSGSRNLYRHESKIEILCKNDYEVMGKPKEEKWSCFNSTWHKTDQIECKPASCQNQPPSNPSHGAANIMGLEHDDTVTYSCDPGYWLNDKRQRTCRYGKWTGTPPTCIEKQCPEPSKTPKHSTINVRRLRSRNVITYTCNKGYKMVGEPTQTCYQGEWSGSQPECKEVGCALKLGEQEKSDDGESKPFYDAGDRIKISCKVELYVLQKNITEATCEKGEWHPSKPTCVPKPCLAYGPIARGKISYSSEKDGDLIQNDAVATVSCEKGYQPDGPQNITCRYGTWKDESGKWKAESGTLKDCVPAPCVFTNSEGTEEAVSHGKSKEVNCTQGFHTSRDLNDGTYVRSVTASCSYGDWWPTSPECQPDGCILPRVSNVKFCLSNETCKAEGLIQHNADLVVKCRERFTWKDPIIDSTVSLTCNLGHLQGDNYSECITEGLGCADPGLVGNSDRIESWPIHSGYFSQEDYMNYTCHPGYLINGFDQWMVIKCLQNGSWNSNLPECAEITCYKPVKPQNGDYLPEKKKYFTNDTVEFTCKEGYFLQGPSNMTCTAGGTWTKWKPDCIREKRKCDTLPEPNSGRIVKSATYPKKGSFVDYICSAGFAVKGPTTINCLPSGSWDQNKTDCEKAVKCANVPAVANAVLLSEKRDYIAGYTVQYKCEDGLIEAADANMSVTCDTRGVWNTSKVICRRKTCSVPKFSNVDLKVTYRSEDGQLQHVTSSDDVKQGTMMLSRCSDFSDFIFEGSYRRVCDRGEWTGDQPSCHKNLLTDRQAPKPSYYVQKYYEGRDTGVGRISEDGELEVTRETSLYIRCYSVFLLKWTVPSSLSDCASTGVCKMNAEAYNNMYMYESLFKNMDVGHTGTYTCYSPDEKSYFTDIRIKVT